MIEQKYSSIDLESNILENNGYWHTAAFIKPEHCFFEQQYFVGYLSRIGHMVGQEENNRTTGFRNYHFLVHNVYIASRQSWADSSTSPHHVGIVAQTEKKLRTLIERIRRDEERFLITKNKKNEIEKMLEEYKFV